MTRAEIEKNLLRVLNAADGVPLPESALVRATQTMCAPEKLPIGDVMNALNAAQDVGLVFGASDPDGIEETTWTLTTKGIHKARK